MPDSQLIHAPTETFHEMVNIERVSLGWDSQQLKDFAQTVIGNKPSSEYLPRDWVTLTYALRRITLPSNS